MSNRDCAAEGFWCFEGSLINAADCRRLQKFQSQIKHLALKCDVNHRELAPTQPERVTSATDPTSHQYQIIQIDLSVRREEVVKNECRGEKRNIC